MEDILSVAGRIKDQQAAASLPWTVRQEPCSRTGLHPKLYCETSAWVIGVHILGLYYPPYRLTLAGSLGLCCFPQVPAISGNQVGSGGLHHTGSQLNLPHPPPSHNIGNADDMVLEGQVQPPPLSPVLS